MHLVRFGTSFSPGSGLGKNSRLRQSFGRWGLAEVFRRQHLGKDFWSISRLYFYVLVIFRSQHFLSIDHLMLRWAKGSDLPWPIYRQYFQINHFFIICFTLFPFPYLYISDDILNMIFSPGPLQASREVKDILVQCWLFNAKYVLIVLMMKINFDSRDRPDFPSLAQTLERLPKKRLARFSNQTLLLSNANSVRFLLLPANCILWVLIYRSPSHPIHLSRSAEALFWGGRLPSSQDVQVSRISSPSIPFSSSSPLKSDR